MNIFFILSPPPKKKPRRPEKGRLKSSKRPTVTGKRNFFTPTRKDEAGQASEVPINQYPP